MVVAAASVVVRDLLEEVFHLSLLGLLVDDLRAQGSVLTNKKTIKISFSETNSGDQSDQSEQKNMTKCQQRTKKKTTSSKSK